ncbi:hypothetical protein BJV78DRAFT_182008 [Lactifluus subvellereus]|nr:hypothetical protein BJV78DRAFT_182008 [Lactifluus subvellereus]
MSTKRTEGRLTQEERINKYYDSTLLGSIVLVFLKWPTIDVLVEKFQPFRVRTLRGASESLSSSPRDFFYVHPHFPLPITIHRLVPESTLHPPCTPRSLTTFTSHSHVIVKRSGDEIWVHRSGNLNSGSWMRPAGPQRLALVPPPMLTAISRSTQIAHLAPHTDVLVSGPGRGTSGVASIMMVTSQTSTRRSRLPRSIPGRSK